MQGRELAERAGGVGYVIYAIFSPGGLFPYECCKQKIVNFFVDMGVEESRCEMYKYSRQSPIFVRFTFTLYDKNIPNLVQVHLYISHRRAVTYIFLH